MTAKNAHHTIPVVDVDQAFPTMVETSSGSNRSSTALDQGPAVRTAIRNVLGVRSRREDPKAFVDALTSAFRLVKVEGHIESQFVPRGYAIQADLGAVSGGQASLYRRATIARAEILRIVDGLTPLRNDADVDDMEAYRVIVRNAVQSLVDEMGLPGGPRVAMVDSYFVGLLGRGDPGPDLVRGQLGALRDRFGLVDDNVNTIEEEGRRTSFWTLVDLVRDLRSAWRGQRKRFGSDGTGFLGTELIHISRLMEAATDQVEELENVLDSVLVGGNERQTITLDDRANLTLDGLLSWLSSFLHDEGRRLAQDAGRDGIVYALAPTSVALATTFKRTLADRILRDGADDDADSPVRYLPASCCEPLPPGMYAARVKIAVASLCRLLLELARRAMRIGRYAGVVLIDITMSTVADSAGSGGLVNVEFRGLNVRPGYELAFVPKKIRARDDEDCSVEDISVKKLVRAIPGTVTTDDESISALFQTADLRQILREANVESIPTGGLVFEAADFPCVIINSDTNAVIQAPPTSAWPLMERADRPRNPHTWGNVPTAAPAPDHSTWGTTDAAAPLGARAAWRQMHPPTAEERTRTAATNMEFSRSTLGEVAAGARLEADRTAYESARADDRVREAWRRLEEVRAEIAALEIERDATTASKKSALTRRIKPLVAEEVALAGSVDELSAVSGVLSAESQAAAQTASRLDEAHRASEMVDDYVRDQLTAVTAAGTDEGGH